MTAVYPHKNVNAGGPCMRRVASLLRDQESGGAHIRGWYPPIWLETSWGRYMGNHDGHNLQWFVVQVIMKTRVPTHQQYIPVSNLVKVFCLWICWPLTEPESNRYITWVGMHLTCHSIVNQLKNSWDRLSVVMCGKTSKKCDAVTTPW